MANYNYKARDEYGKLVAGSMDALSSDDLTAKLRKMGYMATSVTLLNPNIRLGEMIERFRPINAQDLVIFIFQLANMIESGISILTALLAIENNITNRKLREIIGDVRRNIEAGGYFSSSLERHQEVFGKLFVNMIKAGEQSGKLDKVLRRYAIYVESQAEFKAKIKGVLFYPAILFTVALMVIIIIVTFILPKFIDLFTRAGIQVPLITQILFTLGLAIKKYWYLFIIACAGMIYGIKKYSLSKVGKQHFDSLVLKIPTLGQFTRQVYVARFSRTLSTLLSSGVPILQSLDIVKEVIENEVMAEAVLSVRRAVEQGQKMSEPLRVSKEFPLDAIQMIAVGEETGNLDEMLNKVADFYDLTISYTIKKLSALIEPVLLLIMGAMVAFIMASVMAPIFDMVKILRH